MSRRPATHPDGINLFPLWAAIVPGNTNLRIKMGIADDPQCILSQPSHHHLAATLRRKQTSAVAQR